LPADKLRVEWNLEPDISSLRWWALQPAAGQGQREFLAAAARIHARLRRPVFLIIGRGNMADILRAILRGWELAGKAWLTPYCENMPGGHECIDCLVHPQIGTEAFGWCCARRSLRPAVIASALDGIPRRSVRTIRPAGAAGIDRRTAQAMGDAGGTNRP